MTDEEIPGLWRCLRENHLLLGLSGLLCCFLSSSLHSFKTEQISLTFYNINNNPQLCTISNDFINQELLVLNIFYRVLIFFKMKIGFEMGITCKCNTLTKLNRVDYAFH